MKILTFCFSILLVFASSAQEGYLITLKGDTLKGSITFLQNTFYDELHVKNEDGKTTFKAYQVQFVRIQDQAYEPITYANKKVMAQVVTKGALSQYLVRQENESTFNTRVLYKDDEALVISNIGFRKRLIEYLNDCPLLTRQLENKEINPNKLAHIITTYNTNCIGETAEKPTKPDFSELKELSQLLTDILTRVDSDEKVPTYMINALKQYSGSSTDSKVQLLINFLDNK